MNYRKYLVSEAVSDVQKKLAKDFEKAVSSAIAEWVKSVEVSRSARFLCEPEDINQAIQLGWRMVHPLKHAPRGRNKKV